MKDGDVQARLPTVIAPAPRCSPSLAHRRRPRPMLSSFILLPSFQSSLSSSPLSSHSLQVPRLLFVACLSFSFDPFCCLTLLDFPFRTCFPLSHLLTLLWSVFLFHISIFKMCSHFPASSCPYYYQICLVDLVFVVPEADGTRSPATPPPPYIQYSSFVVHKHHYTTQ